MKKFITLKDLETMRSPIHAKKREMPKIEEAVKALRKVGYTQRKIGDHLGVTQGRVSQIENGYKTKRTAKVKRIYFVKIGNELPIYLL